MKPLHELLKGKVVNCQTEEEAKEFLRMAHEQCFRWHSGCSLIDKNYWNTYKGKTCYILIYDTKTVFVDKLNKYYKIITYQQLKQLINENNMETKEVKITAPEGYEIDKENSTFECIKFKPIKKSMTYEDVAKELFFEKWGYYLMGNGCIRNCFTSYSCINECNCTSKKQAEKLIAINKLMNVAKYLNGEWRPNWMETSRKYYIKYSDINNEIYVDYSQTIHSSVAYFESEELAKQAIKILGEETIKLALSTDW